MTPEEIRAEADRMAETYRWDADTRETYRRQLAGVEERKADVQAVFAASVKAPSSRAELAAAGYGLAPAPSLATHSTQIVNGRPVQPPAIAERVAAMEDEARLRWEARMAHVRPLRRPDGKLMHGVYEMDYDILNSVAGPSDEW